MALQPPSPGTERRMRETLHQDPQATARDVQHLKHWLSKQPHLPAVQDDVFLERFLYLCKYRLTRCKEVLDMYYTVRGAVPQLYGNRDPLAKDIQQIYESVFISPMPRLTPDGYRVTFLGLLDADPARYEFVALVRRSLMMIDAHLQMETWLGDVYVFDLKDATLSHLARTPPALIRTFLFCLQDAFPAPIKGIHFLNAPFFMDKILSLLKPFLKEKIRNRIHVHNSVASLYDLFPRDILPDEYGGQGGTIREVNDWWQEQLHKKREWFLSEEKRVTDEKKRMGKIAHTEHLFGLDGSFKTLSID